jgi:endonuclease G
LGSTLDAMKKACLAFYFIWIFCLGGSFASAQSIAENIGATEQNIAHLEAQKRVLNEHRETLKLKKVCYDLLEIGLPTVMPGDQLVWHSSMALAYAEKHEQARWVAHIILPDVTEGAIGRTNDFRVDSLVTTGSAVEADYFLKQLQPDSSYTYDGFGFDRGHLAPSADFRWSAKALSESYLYSNMSPQLGDFNRGIWGDLEDKIREYIYQHPGSALYVVTGPVLHDDLPRIERGVNKVSIPNYYWKVVLDRAQMKAIGFVLPNAPGTKPLELYAVDIDSVERLTGLSFFTALRADEKAVLAHQKITTDWFSEVASGDVPPVPIEQLKRGQISTIMAARAVGGSKNSTVVGKVVSGRTSRAGNVLLNLDKQYPNEIFTVFIKKEDLINFEYDPLEFLDGKRIAVTGKIADLGGKPTMYIGNGKAVEMNTDL